MPGGVLPGSYKEISDLVNELRAAVVELKADLNALRADFRAHDHAATYTPANMRINAAANTITGTETSSDVVAATSEPALPKAIAH